MYFLSLNVNWCGFGVHDNRRGGLYRFKFDERLVELGQEDDW